MYSMLNSVNGTVRTIAEFVINVEGSTLGENFRYIMYKYDIPALYWYKKLPDLLKKIKCNAIITDEESSIISTVEELINVRDNVMTAPILYKETCILIDAICVD